MIDRAQVDSILPAIMVGVLVALFIGALIIGNVPGPGDPVYEQEKAEAKAYCELTFGSDEIYSAGAMFHSGWHCAANGGSEPHLHAVTEAAKEAAYEVQQEGRSVDWDRIDRYRPWYERGMWQVMGLTAATFLGLIVLSTLIQLRKIIREKSNEPA